MSYPLLADFTKETAAGGIPRRITVLATALLAAATAGNALASESGANSADPESALSRTWAEQGAIETGMLPDPSARVPMGSRIDSGDTAIPTAEFGGVQYRLGVDDGA